MLKNISIYLSVIFFIFGCKNSDKNNSENNNVESSKAAPLESYSSGCVKTGYFVASPYTTFEITDSGSGNLILNVNKYKDSLCKNNSGGGLHTVMKCNIIGSASSEMKSFSQYTDEQTIKCSPAPEGISFSSGGMLAMQGFNLSGYIKFRFENNTLYFGSKSSKISDGVVFLFTINESEVPKNVDFALELID